MAVLDRSAPLLLVKLRTTERGADYRVVTDQVLAFKYTDRERKADVAKLTVNNSDLSNFDDPVWRKGGILVVQWGYPGAMSPAREVVITSVKGFRTLEVEAECRSVEMNRVVRARVFENKTLSQIARDLATEAGYGTERQHIEDTEEVIQVVTQGRLTDAQFLRRWAARLGFEFFVDFDGFHFHSRRLGEQPARKLRYHTDPGQGDILEDPTIENDLTAKPGRVRVRGRNPMTREDIDEGADNDSDNERPALAPVIDIVDPETGNRTTVEQRIGGEDNVPTADANATAARRRARGRFRRTQQTAVKMRVPIVGDPLLFAKTVIQIEGMGRRLSIRYYVEEVEHDLSPNGYQCTLRLVSDGHGGHSTESRRAEGLSAVEANPRGAGSGSGVSRDILSFLQMLRDEAQGTGDTQAAAMLDRALQAYSRAGNRARGEVARVLRAVANNPNVSATLREGAAGALARLGQRGRETENGGRVNQREARDDSAELEPVSQIDPETGRMVTTYRQTPARGSGSVSS